MSKDVFMANYSECRDTNREIESNLNYIEEILARLRKMDNCVQKVNVPSNVWNSGNYESDYSTMKRYLNDETTRYNNFHKAFDGFHTPLEKIDAGLKSRLENSLNFIEENKEYGIYVSVIKGSQIDELENGIYNELISRGVSKEEAIKLSALTNENTQNLLKELLALDESELQSKIDEIKHKTKQSPSELVLLDILSLNQPNTYSDTLKDLAKEFARGGFTGVLQSGMLGKALDKYNLDIKSLSGEINKLDREIISSQLGAKKINLKTEAMDQLKAIRDSKLSKVSKFETTLGNMATISKWLGKASTAYNIGKIGYTEWKNVTENGAEFNDAVVDAGIEWGSVAFSAYAGGKIGGAVGTAMGPGVGTAIGVGAGFAGGAAGGFLYGTLVKPTLNTAYKDVVKPTREWIVEKENNVKDWWDSLWW
ncbi:hypothetical protein [Clostridium sp. YIM B02555]|uniref:hypothetical protein n=1 Tax=Clostridium sp. YIM B02555 TaxID=2911968 RepID=UPI001EEDE452|nr:hypothetical protein [Clostridium sp. YIM B02555]